MCIIGARGPDGTYTLVILGSMQLDPYIRRCTIIATIATWSRERYCIRITFIPRQTRFLIYPRIYITRI